MGPSGGKGIRLNHAKNATGRFWCGLTSEKFRTVQARTTATPESLRVFGVADGAGFGLRQIKRTL